MITPTTTPPIVAVDLAPRLTAADELAAAAAHLLAHLNDARRFPAAVAELRRTLEAYEAQRGDAAGEVALVAIYRRSRDPRRAAPVVL